MYKNYKLIKEKELKDINTYGKLLTHEKSGARVLLLENDDENKSFCIGFRTPPYDDTGLPHILEHSVLCGSKKFPVKEPFVELMKSSLNTFLNAMTFPDKTIYPVASCNDKDLNNLMDVYMDAVLYPNIHTKEEIFKQEGWHYELDSVDGEITYNGVVYNEMKGAFSSPDGILGRESLNALFPDTTYGVESGGNPDFIPTLTYEKFKEFHKKYYHPSNSYIVLYGNCNMEEKLKWLDEEYLSKFDKISIDSEIASQKPFDKITEKTVLYPVSKEQGTENKTLMAYNVALPEKMHLTDITAFDIIVQVLLKSAGAPLKKALLENKIGDVIEGDFDSGVKQPVFSISTKNANESDKEKFIEIIEKCLKQFVENGLDADALEAAINNYEFKLREADFGGASKGIIYTINALNTWLYDDEDVFSVLEFTEVFKYLKDNIKTNYFQEVINKYLINNNHKALVICKPSLDVQEIKDKELKEKLNNYKNSLTEEEIIQLINDTKLLKEYQANPDTKEDLDTIPLLKKEDLTYDVLSIVNNKEIIDESIVLHHDLPTNKIAYMRVLFNINTVPSSLYPYLGVFNALLGSLNTKNYSYEKLEQVILTNTGGIAKYINAYVNKNDECNSYLVIDASSLYDKIDFTIEMIKEIISSTDFNNKDRVRECLARQVNMMQQSLIGRGHVKALNRALSYTEESYYISDMVEGIAYLDILSEIMKDYDEKYDEFVDKMNQISKYLFTEGNVLFSFTGDSEGYEIFKKNITKFSDSLNKSEINNDIFKFVPNQRNEGFKAPIDVNYVALTGNFKKEGLPYTGSLLVFENAVKTDYLWKNVRVLGGAYGCMCGFSRTGTLYFTSYRDPNLSKTLDTYKEVLDYINYFNSSEEDLLKNIIGAVGSFDFPKSPSIKGRYCLSCYLQDITQDDVALTKKQIIDSSLEEVKKVYDYVKAIIDQNNITVIGNDKKIESDKSLFKEIKPLFK